MNLARTVRRRWPVPTRRNTVELDSGEGGGDGQGGLPGRRISTVSAPGLVARRCGARLAIRGAAYADGHVSAGRAPDGPSRRSSGEPQTPAAKEDRPSHSSPKVIAQHRGDGQLGPVDWMGAYVPVADGSQACAGVVGTAAVSLFSRLAVKEEGEEPRETRWSRHARAWGAADDGPHRRGDTAHGGHPMNPRQNSRDPRPPGQEEERGAAISGSDHSLDLPGTQAEGADSQPSSTPAPQQGRPAVAGWRRRAFAPV